jgi:4-hydroxy-4-methyl-2-oxoglutarate aldolase
LNIDLHTEELSKLYVAVIADVLDRLGRRNQVLLHNIRPVVMTDAVVVGRAHTVRCVFDATIDDNPYEEEIAAVDAVEPGEIIVLDTGGALDVAIWGELLATRAKMKGFAGAVLDGAVRDVAALQQMGIPTYAGSISANDSRGRVRVVSHGDEVVCGGVRIAPGDYVVADADGVVVVPAAIVAEVCEVASRKVERELESKEALAAGVSAREAYSRYGVL